MILKSSPYVNSHTAATKSTFGTISTTSAKKLIKPSLSTVNLFALAVVLAISVSFSFPIATTFLITSHYPRCGHIVLVSSQRHGSTWFISNAEGCLSSNGSFGHLVALVEIWNHGSVKDITLQQAIDLVRYNTSVKIFPDALYDQRDNVTAFFKAVRRMQIPVFVLRRQLEKSFASWEVALKTKVWNTDTGGAAVEREFESGPQFSLYRKRIETYFNDMHALMRDIGVVWDEVHYEEIITQRFIFGKNAKCYIRNCNLE